jgi:DNA-binding transcriptional LysR family regulator
MDWRSIKFDWNRARAFLVTAEEGSLSAAARALSMNQPTLGRQVAALEEELGVALFERAGRGLELTPSGLDLVEHVRAMGDAATKFSLAASGQSDILEGNICITATEAMAAFELPAIIHKLRQQAPGIEIELIASNSSSDLKRREADIAIRAFRPTQPDLIAKKLREVYARLYAASGYLKKIGHPVSPSGFSDADFIGFNRQEEFINGLNERGFSLTYRNFPIITENHLVHWELVKQGVGIGVMPENIGDAEPLVDRVLPDIKPFEIELWLVAHRELKTSRRVRTVFDFLVEELSRS